MLKQAKMVDTLQFKKCSKRASPSHEHNATQENKKQKRLRNSSKDQNFGEGISAQRCMNYS